MPTVTSLTAEPNLELLPAYRPMNYRALVSGDPTDYPAALEVEVQINGVAFGGRIPVEHFSFDNSGATAISLFSFSIAERVQSFFDLALYWPPLLQASAQADPSFVALVELHIFTLYPNLTTGVLEDAGTEVISQTLPVCNAYRRADEEATLLPFDIAGYVGQTVQVRFLTNKPNRAMVALDDSEWLGVYTKGFFSYRINAYDWNGNLQGTGQLATGATVFGADEITILPVGPAQINAVPPGDWLPNTGPVTIDEDTRYYLVQAGWHCPDGNFYNFSEIRRFYLIPSSCRKHRFHFVNPFGCIDSFSVYNAEQVAYITESEEYTRSLPPNFGIVDAEKERVQSEGRVQIVSQVGNITNDEARWLGRDFALTVQARLQEGQQYIPVTVKDGQFPLQSSEQPLDNVKFTINYSQRDISQRS